MPHRTSSTRNDYERKIKYDWHNLTCFNKFLKHVSVILFFHEMIAL